MKNQTTYSTISRAKKPLAGLFLLMVLAFQLSAQPQPNCNSHFYHHSFNSANVYFYGSFNHPGTTYAWNFGDGDTSSMINPVHPYAASGTYYVCLTVTRTDTAGALLCSSTTCDSVQFTMPPPPPPPVCNAHFTHHSMWNSGIIDFDAAGNPPGATYLWVYGDGSTSTVRDTVHAYTSAGTYYACLTVTKTDTAGVVLCTDTWCDSVHVANPAPPPPPVCNAHFYHHRGFGTNVYFYGTHNAPGTTYAWSFGDGSTDTLRNTTHSYAPGAYNACLTVTKTDTAGNVLCTDSWCDSVHVAPPPPPCNAHFYSNHHGHNLHIRFDAAPNPSSVTYAWDFGDGDTSTARNPVHTYALPGAYNACLTVTNTDTAGVVICTATWCDSVHVDSTHACYHWHHCNFRMGAGTASADLVEIAATVYPNPVTENSVLHIENTTGSVSFKVFESTGRLVSSRENLTNGDFELKKNELGSGIYFYQVTDSNGSVCKGKLIVQ